MRKSVLIIAFFLSYLNTLAQEKDNFRSYNNSIDWSFFKGVPNDDSLSARITTFITLEIVKVSVWNGNINFKAYAQMNTLESWVRAEYANESTLQHEQTHFNITEICARALQTELNRMKIKSRTSPKIQAAFSNWQNKMENLQKQFDLETQKGHDRETQNIWYQKISAELN